MDQHTEANKEPTIDKRLKSLMITLTEVFRLDAEKIAMDTENVERRSKGLSDAYTSKSFWDIEGQLASLKNELQK